MRDEQRVPQPKAQGVAVKGRLRVCLALVTLSCLAVGGAAATTIELKEGKDYVRSKAPAAGESASKIEVLEFFSYAGAHSQEAEPYVAAWRETLPADVEFHRVPVLFATRWLELAKVCYTLEALGVEKSLAREVFAGLQRESLPLYRERAFLDWAERKGFDRAKVAEVYNSPQIEAKIIRAKTLTQIYDIQIVPTFVVDNKFATDYEHVGKPSRFPSVVDALIDKVRAERLLRLSPAHAEGQLAR